MDMPRKGYTSLTLKDEAAQRIQKMAATWPTGQSGLILDVFDFMDENWEDFEEFCKKKEEAS